MYVNDRLQVFKNFRLPTIQLEFCYMYLKNNTTAFSSENEISSFEKVNLNICLLLFLCLSEDGERS